MYDQKLKRRSKARLESEEEEHLHVNNAEENIYSQRLDLKSIYQSLLKKKLLHH